MTTEHVMNQNYDEDDERRERATQILKILEGMSIFEARELLKFCEGAIEFSPVLYTREEREARDLSTL